MKIDGSSLGAIDWSTVQIETLAGATGVSKVRAVQSGEIQVRLVEYSAGYMADHWCSKGHIIHVISGQLEIDRQDGEHHCVEMGMSYHVTSGDVAHRVRTNLSATVFIVD